MTDLQPTLARTSMVSAPALTLLDTWELLSPDEQTGWLEGLSSAERIAARDILVGDARARAEYASAEEAERLALAPRRDSWRPCATCQHAGGYSPSLWPRLRQDGFPASDFGWPTPGHTHARPEQLFDWSSHPEWLFRAGRGTGKTRAAAEDRLELAMRYPGTLWYVVAPTKDDGRDYCFFGESGLVSIAKARGWCGDKGATKGPALTLLNGSQFVFRSGEEPERLRGPNAHGAWG